MQPDHRPYLLPTDLVTAEDVLAWLDARALIAPAEPVPSHSSFWVLAAACDDLRARLDRERRQACRRGCSAMFREACRERAQERWRYTLPRDAEHARHRRRSWLTRALAFRAAARAK